MSQEVSTGRFIIIILQAERLWPCAVRVGEEDDRTLQACAEGDAARQEEVCFWRLWPDPAHEKSSTGEDEETQPDHRE